MSNILEINNLYKSYGDVKAVHDLSFKVKRGQLFAFLGVNGAGKSTTISIICGQLKKNSGEVLVDGLNIDHDISAVKQKLGVVFQSSTLDKALTVKENLENRAALYGITGKAFKDRLKELSELLNFSDLLTRTLGNLSGGQKRRIDVARALFHRPQILILDEPTTGLDPQTRILLWKVITKLRTDEGVTVFLTTHYMEEAADADYVVILDGGEKVAEGTPYELKNRYSGDFVTIYGVPKNEIDVLGVSCQPAGDGFRFEVKNTGDVVGHILKNPQIFRDFEVEKGQMDAIFLAVTGKTLIGDECDEATK